MADGLSAGFIALAATLTAAGLLYAAKNYETHGSLLQGMTLVFLGAFNGFVLAGDLLTMFVFLEFMGITSYALTAFKVNDDAPAQAAFNVAVTSMIGAVLFLIGATMVYATTGTPSLAEAGAQLAEVATDPAIAVAFTLLVMELSVKATLFPFHFAHADSHSVAPAPQAGLFGAVMIQAGLYGIARLHGVLFNAPAMETIALQQLLLFGAIASLSLPLVPGWISGTEKAAEVALEGESYIEAVLGGATVPSEHKPDADIWKGESLAKGALAAGVAVVVGIALALVSPKRRASSLVPLRVLRRLHSGHVGDYVAWLTAGTALGTAWCLATL